MIPPWAFTEWDSISHCWREMKLTLLRDWIYHVIERLTDATPWSNHPPPTRLCVGYEQWRAQHTPLRHTSTTMKHCTVTTVPQPARAKLQMTHYKLSRRNSMLDPCNAARQGDTKQNQQWRHWHGSITKNNDTRNNNQTAITLTMMTNDNGSNNDDKTTAIPTMIIKTTDKRKRVTSF